MISRAKRIARKRGKHSPLLDGVVYVGRPTFWANPFSGRQWGHAKSVKLHARWLTHELGDLSLERLGFCPAEIDALGRLRVRVLGRIAELAGHDLACWCPLASRWCHADTLLDLAPVYAEQIRRAA